MEWPAGGRKAAETLRVLQGNIASGEWPVNSKIPKEPELMEMLGVGKSTVREAVRSLASMGMLEPIKGVGTFVRSRTPVSSVVSRYIGAYPLDEIVRFRRLMEIEAVQRAAENRTESQLEQLRRSHEAAIDESPTARTPRSDETPGNFHQLLFEAAGNSLMTGLYSALMASVRKATSDGSLEHGEDQELRQRDHARILAAVEAQEPEHAADAMALHVDRDLVIREAGAPRRDPAELEPQDRTDTVSP